MMANTEDATETAARISNSLLAAARHQNHASPVVSGRVRGRRAVDVEAMDPADTEAPKSKKPRGRGRGMLSEADAAELPGRPTHMTAEHPPEEPMDGYEQGTYRMNYEDYIPEESERVKEILARLRDTPFTGYSRYTQDQIHLILELYRELGEVKMTTAHRVASIPGYEKVSPKHIRYWLTPRSRKAVGRPIEPDFENQILQALVAQNIIVPESEGEQFIFASDEAPSYETIRHFARMVQSQPEWQAIQRVKQLQMSNRWVFGFLRRHGLQRMRLDLDDDEPILELEDTA